MKDLLASEHPTGAEAQGPQALSATAPGGGRGRRRRRTLSPARAISGGCHEDEE